MNFEKVNRKLSVTLIAVCAAQLLFLMLFNSQTISNFSYRLHEILSLPVFLGYFIIPVLMLVWLVIWIRYRVKIKTIATSNFVLNCSAILILLICISFHVVNFNEYSMGGFIESKDMTLGAEGVVKSIVIDGQSYSVKNSSFKYDFENNPSSYHIECTYNKLTKRCILTRFDYWPE